MTKKDLIAKGKVLGLNLKESSLKADLEKAVTTAEKKNKAIASKSKAGGEY